MPPSIQDIYNQQIEGVERQRRAAWKQDLSKWRKALEENAKSPEAYIEVARFLSKLGQNKEAHAVLARGLTAVPLTDAYPLFQWHIRLLEECNLTEEAIHSAEHAAALFPDDVWIKLRRALLLPIIYGSTEQIGKYRVRFSNGLHRLTKEIPLETPAEKKNALKAVAAHSNLRLGYQAGNDRDLQMEYGSFLQRVMAASFPDWSKPISVPSIPTDGKLRIGYVSSRFRNLSAAKYFFGWIREHQKDAFSVYAYHVSPKTDSVTEQVKQASHAFRHIPNSMEQACKAILSDQLHVLVFLDVGLEPLTTQLAALRLAPIQCAAWDQPITTGLSTIDYFVSSELTEPQGAQNHYSEELMCLPGVGVCYQKPVIPAALLTKTRSDFQLRDDAVVYLCIQYAYKYLPDQDPLLTQIAARVSNAQFVFLTENELIAEDLRLRLDRAFSGANLKAADYCVILPALERFTYWNLSLVGDVFLDAIGWSGGVSTFEAIACRVPVVTLPGEFMRGRQSFAILKQLGATETIARDNEDFVNIAVRLGLDRQWRDEIVQQMSANYSALYSDTRCVRALEEFYRRKVAAKLRTQDSTAVSGGGK